MLSESYRIVEMNDLLKNPELLKSARNLTISSNSGMNRALNYYQRLINERPVNCKTIFAFSDGIAVGWLLLTHENDGYIFEPKDSHACIHVYVHPDFRRRKIGSTMVWMAKNLFPTHDLNAYVHNNPYFFNPLIERGLCRDIY